ncbi:M14 family zinc carboxypeptidase [Roseisolibacter sp. H3M3-2]|uniref:M14 family zinc carboxypeptidase n=1 Tax=Roseisolibacter sp. H3M3-2 TaxID=3031323 RepID=UPI0023DA55BD|nr:M14 family zinc carboxypeptidase [Roseisolibacter sp. H3M3-2]MDF1503927.1 M14 family zinc carboxypeptidase [Roseisolibacter sp. H3M3-2]
MRRPLPVPRGPAALALLAAAAAAPVPARLAAQQGSQAIDTAYTRVIRELTPTDPRYTFTTELVDYLPASATVPTPLKVLGYVPGTVGKLTHVAEVNKYFRALAEKSPRTKIFSLGTSDEGREEIVMAIADEATLARLDDYKRMSARLADPRGLTAEERARLIKEAKPIYWVLGSIHSPETGSPEMLMEMAYRLAVDEGVYAKSIRENVITLITPVQEVDGRDRMVDVYNQSERLKLGPTGRNLVYWGKYTAHDNNRDGMVISQKITQNYLKGFLDWKPIITHDLHESVPFLYTSTGTGPYNDQFDPIQVNEWHQLAYQEINELTRRGLPGVWTHGFYDGWAPNYMLAISNFHNALGRFYETYTSSGAGCHTVNLGDAQTQKEWFRPNPAVNGVRWCIRSNVNYQQSGVMIALKYVGDHKETFLENYAAKAERQTRKGRTEAPYAFVIPRGQRHAAEAADFVNLLRLTATEVHEATGDFTVNAMPKVVEGRSPAPRADRPVQLRTTPVQVKAGDWIVRMDQPYTQLPRTLLATQTYKPTDPSPYDDTGWTLDELRHVVTHTVADSAVLTRPMRLLGADPTVAGRVTGEGATLIVRHLGDWRSAVLPWKAGGRVRVADSAFTAGGATFPAGTFLVESPKGAEAVRALGLEAVAVAGAPAVKAHAVTLPRIAYVHTWQETQNEGWVRFALDQMGVPYTYMADQKLRNPGALDRYDVVVFPHSGQGGMTIVNGRPMTGPAVPWRATKETPHLGKWDETDDQRPGMGLEGAAALRRFVERGGLLLVEGSTSRLPIETGMTPQVTEVQARTLQARGAVFRAQPVAASPILYGYDDRTSMPVYFNQTPLLQIGGGFGGGGGGGGAAPEGVDPSILAAQERARPRVVLRFHDNVDSLRISGMLNNPQELLGRPAVVDAPLGQGHVVSFAIRPFWRHQTQGSWALALNAIANWNALSSATAAPARATAAAGAGARTPGGTRQ